MYPRKRDNMLYCITMNINYFKILPIYKQNLPISTLKYNFNKLKFSKKKQLIKSFKLLVDECTCQIVTWSNKFVFPLQKVK